MTDARQHNLRAWLNLLPFKRHRLIFVVVGGLLLGTEFLLGADWALFWPLMIWISVLALHYFVASALDPDQNWIEERAEDLRARSYDFEHIRDIERRISEGDPSVSAHSDREVTISAEETREPKDP